MSGNTCVRLLAATLLTLGVSASAAAQFTTGTVVGTVKDVSGGVLPGATVTLMSESRGTKLPDVVTNGSGDFIFVNVAPDSYQLIVTMPSFKTLTRGNVTVSPGDRVPLNTLTLEVGGASETVNVTADAATLQARSGERSFTIETESVANLPILSRSFTALALLAPGVTQDNDNTPQRLGGGGSTNIMMDGVSAMDTGSNRPLLQMNVESIAEVKVLTSNYQAEFGRASGVQVSAVTKSGTNRFHGSVYGVIRDSDWDSNSKTNKLNGNPKTVREEKDMGFTIGGPIGKPGGDNKLFFFYSQEFSPRTRANNATNFRVPTAAERAGDFSGTLDNNGVVFNFIKDPTLSGACSATDTSGCFRDGGVLGKIPQSRLYQTGVAILNRYPLPNLDPTPGCGTTAVPCSNFNHTTIRPEESVLSWQPALRADYQPMSSLRMSVKYSAWQQAEHTFVGTIPGFNDAKMQGAPVSSLAITGNYMLSPTTFIEATFGRSKNELAGCAQAQSMTGAIFCNESVPMTDAASLSKSGLGGLPFLFPDATVLDPDYYAVQALNELQPAFWDGARMEKVPTLNFGGRYGNNNLAPQIGFPGWLNINATNDFSATVTRVQGRHTLKAGYYHTYSFKAEQTSNNAFGTINFQNDAVGTNPFDTGHPLSNAAIGTFSSFQQAQKYAETSAVYQNIELFVQDNWKASSRLTFDYGLRFVFQRPQYDQLGQASNFLPDRWSLANAPQLYRPTCSNGVFPCSTGAALTFRRALDPVSNQVVGTNTTLGLLNTTLVPNSGDPLNGVFLPGQGGVPRATYNVPTLVYAPRFGIAYDLTGDQTVVVRGGAGIFYDRPSSTTFSGGVNNPPTSGTVTQNYAQLQSLASGGLITRGAPGLNAFAYEGEVPTSVQWNGGIQMALPWSSSLDVAYSAQHSFNFYNGVNINAVDYGARFLEANQDRTLAASATPGATAQADTLLRSMRGYGSINTQLNRAWRTYHSLQLNFQRRFSRGISFGFIDTISLYDHQQANARLQHDANGAWSYRADQGLADELLGVNSTPLHTTRTTFVWDLPDLNADGAVMRTVAAVLNDWQFSGVWQLTSGTKYSVGFSYQSGATGANVTGSNDYNNARVLIVGDPEGQGCSSDVYRQFDYTIYAGPPVGSVGLDSGQNYLTGCMTNVFDVAIARNIRLGGSRTVQLRVDMYNAPNRAGITGRATTINYQSVADQTVTNSPFDPVTGEVLANRTRPNQAGVGAVNGYQSARQVQATVRFSF